MPILARHVAKAAGTLVTGLKASCADPVDLLATMQFLALEIAGSSMFSLETEWYGAELRDLIKGYAAHLGRRRHRRLWPRPEIFDPSRFLPPALPPDRFAFLPFGIGPRVCIGAQFALTEATLVLAALIRTFHVRAC